MLRDFGAKGRHKIQDLWGPIVHIVLKAPKDRGSVYTIAPANDHSRIKHVHRTLLKAVVGAGAPDGAAASSAPLPDEQPSEDELPHDGDLFVLRREISPPAAPVQTATVTRTTPQSLPPQVAPVPTVPGPCTDHVAGAPSTHIDLPPVTYPNAGEAAVRRSVRSTAGQHSNINHLPRPAGDLVRGAANSSGPTSNAVSALFRPWN